MTVQQSLTLHFSQQNACVSYVWHSSVDKIKVDEPSFNMTIFQRVVWWLTSFCFGDGANGPSGEVLVFGE